MQCLSRLQCANAWDCPQHRTGGGTSASSSSPSSSGSACDQQARACIRQALSSSSYDTLSSLSGGHKKAAAWLMCHTRCRVASPQHACTQGMRQSSPPRLVLLAGLILASLILAGILLLCILDAHTRGHSRQPVRNQARQPSLALSNSTVPGPGRSRRHPRRQHRQAQQPAEGPGGQAARPTRATGLHAVARARRSMASRGSVAGYQQVVGVGIISRSSPGEHDAPPGT